jgi:hypothetical protein
MAGIGGAYRPTLTGPPGLSTIITIIAAGRVPA